MRRLGMKSKRRKSEMSTSESEENGDARAVISEDEMNSAKENEAETMKDSPAKKNMPKKRLSRGRSSQKLHAEDPVENPQSDTGNTHSVDQENGNATKSSPSKRRKKDEQKDKGTPPASKKPGKDNEYEVAKIVGHRTIKGRRQFLVRWKGYNEDCDTWENEKELNCPALIEEFLSEEAEGEENVPEKNVKLTKMKPQKTDKRSKKTIATPKKQSENDIKADMEGDSKNDKDNQKEFEVERIIEVRFKKNKMREFLIRWKGFSAADDTWEPEKNLNCPELIAKFMKKLEKAKTADMRELRTNPTHTKRYTLTTHEAGRRLSRRNMDKQRATYHECDE